MAKVFPFFFSSDPEYKESEIIDALRSDDDERIKKMTDWLLVKFHYVWQKCIKRSWDTDVAQSVFYEAIEVFIRAVKNGTYKEGNWIGYCRNTAKRKFEQKTNRRKVFDDLEESQFPQPISYENPYKIDKLLPVFAAIEWEKPYSILLVAEWYNEGYGWSDIRLKLNQILNDDFPEVSLRKDWERALNKVRIYLIAQEWDNNQRYFNFCYGFCKEFVALRLVNTRADKIQREHPEIVDVIMAMTDKADFSQASNAQFKKCIDCLVKQMAH